MAFCPNCGAQVAGTFCPNCGSQVTGGGTGPAAGTGPGTGAGMGAGSAYTAPPPPIAQAPGLTTNVASALCYLFGLITGIIFLVIAPYNQNKTVRFHAFQAIFGSIAVIICSIVLAIFIGIFITVTHLWSLAYLYRLYDLVIFILWLYMMYTAYTNKKVKLPLIGDLAEKQA